MLSVESTHDRIKRRQLSNEDSKKEKESFEVFASEITCRNSMVETFGFPAHLFSNGWAKSNGFAGSKQIPRGNISWFRMLVKMIKGVGEHNWDELGEYYWHEMTFLVHQIDGPNKVVTVICFEVPDDDIDQKKNSNVTEHGDERSLSKPTNFLKELATILNSLPTPFDLDWRYMQSLLLRQAIMVADVGIWACSYAVRNLEKSRPTSSTGISTPFDFPRAHDLLRHALHSTEVLQVASQNLEAWVRQYQIDQKRTQRLQHEQQQNHQQQLHQQSQNQQGQNSLTGPFLRIPFEEDLPLPPESFHDDLIATLQLLSNLVHRSTSNDARLRNEINLAFNLVNQQDTKAMRRISIVTLLFLPATFVSTLFSMCFFDYDGGSGRWSISKWIWLYFVIAGILTIITFIAWFRARILWRFFR
ncbi:hypothetical protein LTR70_009299 [Exophiala xenobiotica]|uniref:Uncharacterized protein n=1 Tax=Lithohypha guttulata TaxID=1690604 RepID=A0ABR0JYK6_9EURO|nr:hypothetical protein LTR24_009028 [Lithohypha guttulata]KAK5310701.1 hypothetical protein LTR70_009299 [Exophiala xenobiotica]